MKLKTIIIAAAASIAMQLGASWVDVHVIDSQKRESLVDINVGAWFSGHILYGDALDEKYAAKTAEIEPFSQHICISSIIDS